METYHHLQSAIYYTYQAVSGDLFACFADTLEHARYAKDAWICNGMD